MITATHARILEKELIAKATEELDTKAKEFCDSLDEIIKSKIEKREHTVTIEVPYEIKQQIKDILEDNGYGARMLNGGSIEIRW